MTYIYLNVGGVCYVTRPDTLRQGDTFFAALLAHTEDCEEIFIDRDPTHFRHILNWLRGIRSLPLDAAVLHELIPEADYFSMADMKQALQVALCDAHRRSIARSIDAVAAELRQQ